MTSGGDAAVTGDHVVYVELDLPDRWAGRTPGPRCGDVAAELAQRVASGPAARAVARRAIQAVNADSLRHASDKAEVPAGVMTIEQSLLPRFGERQVQAYLVLDVYPPGAPEAASLILSTVHLDLVGEVGRHGRSIAESLRLMLGGIPGGRRTA